MRSAVAVGRRAEPILIVGLGNLLRRDDGIGCRVAERLEQCSLPSNVRVVDVGTGGMTLLGIIEGYSTIYLIDALQAQLEPGTITRRRLSQLRDKSPQGDLDPHGQRILSVFRLAEVFGERYDPVIYGVQPRDVSYGLALSEPVQQALDRLVGMILEEIATQRNSALEEGDNGHD